MRSRDHLCRRLGSALARQALFGSAALGLVLATPALGDDRLAVPPLSVTEAALGLAPVAAPAAPSPALAGPSAPSARSDATSPDATASVAAAPVRDKPAPTLTSPAQPMLATATPEVSKPLDATPPAGTPATGQAAVDPLAIPAAQAPAAAPPAPAPVAAPAAPPAAPVVATTPDAVVAALAARLAEPEKPQPGKALPGKALPGKSATGRKTAIADSLRAALQAFYAQRAGAPAWVERGALTPPAQAAMARLGRADEDGLDPKTYAPAALSALSGPATPADAQAEAELAVSAALVAYAGQAASGRVDPRTIARDIVADQHRPDALGVLVDLAIAADPAAVLDAYNPAQPGYTALRAKLAELRAADAAVTQAPAPIPAGPTLRPGMQDARVAALRMRLGIDETFSDADTYDDDLAEAVRAFQRRRNLKVNGLVGAQTLSALNGARARSAAAMEAEIVANMERWRWMPRELGERHILVNVPDYHLWLMQGETVDHEARVVVGKPSTPTPIFSDRIQFLVLNPSWTVPQSIIRKEYLPKLADDPDYLTRHGYVVTYQNGQMQVRQPPGEGNALGHIKFMFPNTFSVYLHDTSQRRLFAADTRAFSHGCVRVDDPDSLAELVLGPGSGWTAPRIERLVGGKERRIDLRQPVPVHIAYFTARVDETGELKMIDDVYGYSRKVKAALGLAS